MRDNIIVGLILFGLLSILGCAFYFTLQDKVFTYDMGDKYNMTNCVFIKKGNSLENTWYDIKMNEEVVCDEGTYTYFEYDNQYTILEVEKFKNLLKDLEE